MKEVIIDCQILQTAAFHRGMGKYTVNLLKAFIELNLAKKEPIKVIVILNKNLEDRSGEIISSLGKVDIMFLDIPTDISTDTDEKYKLATKVVTGYVDTRQKKNTEVSFLIMAPFFVDFPSVFPTTSRVIKYSLVYDLIPYKIWHLQRIFPDNVYAQHFRLFVEADHLFTISNAVKDDLITLVGADEHNITSVDGGPFMSEADIRAASTDKLLKRPYILFPSGPIVHKNNERAVRAFVDFNARHDNEYTLYVTSNFDEATQQSLCALSDKVEFTGNIDDSSLIAAYLGAEAVMFASLAEGLGMPVLESVLCEVPVACSNIPVLKEISDRGFYFFDPLSVKDISEALENAAGKKDWQTKKESHSEISKKYSWSRSAGILTDIIDKKLSATRKVNDTIQLSLPVANESGPGNRLSEKLYMPISRKFSRTGLLLKTMSVEPQAPSYVAYLPQDELSHPDYTLDISPKKNWNPFNRDQILTLALMDRSQNKDIGVRRVIELKAFPRTIDKALGIQGWQYKRLSGEVCEPHNLVNWITRGDINL